MKLNNEQLEFIKTQMELCIDNCNKLVDKYGWNDEATAGCDDAIGLAKIIIAKIKIELGFSIKDVKSFTVSNFDGDVLCHQDM